MYNQAMLEITSLLAAFKESVADDGAEVRIFLGEEPQTLEFQVTWPSGLIFSRVEKRHSLESIDYVKRVAIGASFENARFMLNSRSEGRIADLD